MFEQMAFQLPMYTCLVVSWVLGKHIGCKGLRNNTRLFGVLYVFVTIISEFGEFFCSVCANVEVRSQEIVTHALDNFVWYNVHLCRLELSPNTKSIFRACGSEATLLCTLSIAAATCLNETHQVAWPTIHSNLDYSSKVHLVPFYCIFVVVF